MLNANIDQNLSIIKEHCRIPPYHEKQISSAATPKESNDRILKFLEEKYSHICDYDEFFVVLRKLIEMPEAMTIIDSFQKSTYEMNHDHAIVCVCMCACGVCVCACVTL